MLMSNLIEYSSNYSDTTSSFWFYSKDKETNFHVDIGNNNVFESLEYKAKLLETTVTYGNDSIL